MGEKKEYISKEDALGNIHISEDVIAVIAATAAIEVEGVTGLTTHLGSDLAELLGGKKSLSKGVRLQINEDRLTVELSIMIQYGYAIQNVAKAVQDAVFSGIESVTGLTVEAVNIVVGGITFEKGSKKETKKTDHK